MPFNKFYRLLESRIGFIFCDVNYFHSHYRKYNTANGILICSKTSITLSDSQADELIRKSQRKEDADHADGEKAGRGSIYYGELRSGERFALRRYVRGGFVKHISEAEYLNLPLSSLRPLIEIEISANLFAAGVKVVEPLFTIIEYGALGFSFSGAIATSQVIGAQNFFEVSSKLPEAELERIAFDAGVEAVKVLKEGVFHRDLHPGNVILDSDKNVILLDFDKAIRFKKESIVKYVQPTIDRWDRAVKKRSLNPVVSVQFLAGVNEELSKQSTK